MSKRKAATDLNHDNWDREEEPEVAGKFQEAPKEVVQERVIRTAKRRLQATGASASPGGASVESKKLFSGFTGFGPMKTSSTSSSVSEIAKNSFSFLKKSDTPLKTKSTDTKNDSDKLSGGETNVKYLSKLKGLNEAVLDWIKQHVESNPCCILTPVFRDYDNYLKEIQSEKDNSASPKPRSVGFSFGSEAIGKTSTPSTFSLGSSSASDKVSAPPSFALGTTGTSEQSPSARTFSLGPSSSSLGKTSAPPKFSLGSADASQKTSSAPSVSLGSSPLVSKAPSFGLPAIKKDKMLSLGGVNAPTDSKEKKPLFSFGSSSSLKTGLDMKISFPSTPPGGAFTFSSLNKPSESSGGNAETNNGDNDEEPEPEPVKPVTEEDAIYTQRVKVFVKKGDGYSDRGVGNLFIKEAPNGWHQAIVRNDTSIGNIIFNILLSGQHPTKRLGKNNVMIVCQPTPDHTGPALPVLLRVKTSEDADKLLETIEKYKKK